MSKVEKTFSFASWASDHPSDPVPGDRIDIEFNAHRAAIESLDQALSRLLRADGKLNHDLLTEESMPRDLLVALAGKTKREIQEFVDPLVAQTKHHLSDLEAAQFDLQATLAEIKQRQREATKLLDSTAALSEIVHAHARQAMQAVTRAANVQAQTIEDANWQTLQANTSQDWALVSTTWAEFMDGNATIPPNILASNSITGDHWSSRWWAHRAAGAAGMLAWWYQGAWPSPGPPSTPDDPTGQPLPPGSIYFDTDDNKMYVWTGSSWVPLAQGPAAATTSSLYYLATAGQTVFPLTSNDHFGASFGFNQTHPEGLHALVNGVRLTPTDDYAVNVASSTVTLARPMSLNAVVGFDILTPVSQLSPSGSAKTYLLSPLAPDGVATVFTLTVAAGSPVVNVAHNEELLVVLDGVQQSPGQAYNASGNQITFAQPPDANSVIFIIWFGPSATTQSVAPATSLWSADDAAANGMTLSNGGLTAAGVGAGWKSLRSTVSKTSGKLYFECFIINNASNGIIMGLADAGFVISSYLGTSPQSTGLGGIGIIMDDRAIVSGGFTSKGTVSNVPAANDVWGFAVDFTGGNIWVAINNVWAIGGNPATGSLPIVTFVQATVGALFAGASLYDASNSVTLQSTAASQKYAPPSGFKAWDAP